ncbi:LOW QUALITY PROTEIN: leucine-rich repeat-containing G-protein coupled receptor 5 [Drosophila sulfurigaster albostrigata]|uniref:LOW QUALITY PROTEIN: leucine-rich repeat-containing G-protein coupled receptor 5 n=1 Tax=Drosophila sulfurigaster albostrigata TaxID=89887 RepID=UPI002D21C529|nr:LOW QUALITY PROTEIN: leucine-rich repeat-containing G-protein coupled receptor 5 [Drosophila sulfurigaster albostrigata]
MAAHCRRRRQLRSDAGKAAATATTAIGLQLLLLSALLSVLATAMSTSMATSLNATSSSTQNAAHNETKEYRSTAKQQLSEISVNIVSSTPTATPIGIRENVMLPSSDPEREAQILYEKSLQEYHGAQRAIETVTLSAGDGDADVDSNVSGNGSKSSAQRNLHSVCELWLQKHCHCTGSLENLKLSCRSIGILAVPVNLPSEVLQLDLGNNNITRLEANSFFMVPHLEELTLSDNSIINMDPYTFYGLAKLKRLSLQNCGLKSLAPHSFQGLGQLVSLQLNGNALVSLDGNCLGNLLKLRSLRLEGNLFYRIPTNALAGLRTLEALNLGSNLLTIINDDDFPRMPNLIVLLLKRNQIMKISAGALKNLTALKVLELDDNLISSLPEGLSKLTQLQELSMTSNRLRWINDTELPRSMQILDFRANPLSTITNGAFRGMTKLRKLILSDVRTLRNFPELEACHALEILKLDRAGIQDVPAKLCRQTPRLKSLELKTNSLKSIPNLNSCRDLRLLDLSSNQIESLQGRPFFGLKQLHDLLLSYNRIKSLPQDAFQGIPKLQLLDLEGNEIAFIHKDAFAVFTALEDLNLGNNIFPHLPEAGLSALLHLKTFNNPKLREFPPPETFPRIQTLILSYAYHCCAFLPLVAMSAQRKTSQVQEAVLFPSDADFDMTLWNTTMMNIWPQMYNLSKQLGASSHELWDSPNYMTNYKFNEDLQQLPTGSQSPSSYMEDYFESHDVSAPGTGFGFGTGLFSGISADDLQPGSVQCLPMPGPFLPCADLFDWWTLRCGVWVVFLLALLGNGTVVFVLVCSRSKMDVPRFLVCNLAAADFFMGIYLGILAIVDAATLGEFRMFAIPWQMSLLCQLAGFLAVLSSELSVYTLAVITLERNYAITHAIHLNKRLSLRQAGYIMSVGWIFALMMALLPLLGVSDYRKFAVCLPFETTTGPASLTYVISLMFINGCAFLTLMGCYLKMYWAIRGSQAWNTNDSRIAKRMALLVFTDFLCWSPIAFFSITAIFGLQLISLEQAKIFTVFVLPLNSCCNPFLYAIMTKQFKKDCVTLCKHFEETRVGGTTAARAARGKRGVELPPPLLPAAAVAHPPGCRCLRMLPSEMPNWHKMEQTPTLWQRLKRLCCGQRSRRKQRRQPQQRRQRAYTAAAANPYQYQFAELRQQRKNRASSISSENFCSSRSSSWRHGANSSTPAPQSNCSMPLKLMDPSQGHTHGRRRHSAWLITRKTSQDSNLSSSRNDSSASATTASTSTFRLSRSSAGSSTPLPSIIAHNGKQQHETLNKPRLVRQEAVQEEEDSSPPRLGVRFLPTIPSAADSSVIMEDGDSANAAAGGAAFLGMPLPGVSSGFLVTPPAQLQPDKPPPAPNDAPP